MTAPGGPPPAERLHALDNLRAVMMWLGIVLHVAANHLTGPSPLPWRDRALSPWADLITAVIHAFRMPVFFIVAGYFVALLVQRRGWVGMLHNRFRRLAVPFLVLWPPIGLGVGLAALAYWHVMVRGHLGLDLALVPQLRAAVDDKPVLNTVHLWFVVQLWWLSLAGAGLIALWQWRGRHWLPLALLSRGARQLAGTAWGPLALALPLALVGTSYPDGVVLPQGSLWPPLAEWLHNGTFFVFGVAVFLARDTVLPQVQRRCFRWLLAGVPFFLAAAWLVLARQQGLALPGQPFWAGLTYNAATWCWSLGLVGLFLRLLPSRHPVLAYLADSAYAVYVVHLVATIGFGALLFNWEVAAGWKMAANVALSTAASLAVYQGLVRGTWVGRLLNGRVQGARAPGS